MVRSLGPELTGDAAPDVTVIDLTGRALPKVQEVVEQQLPLAGGFVIVLVPDELWALEWRLRERGADAVVRDDVGADALADACRRALQSADTRTFVRGDPIRHA